MSDKLDRWIGHMAHLAVGIEFVPKCWVCEIGNNLGVDQRHSEVRANPMIITFKSTPTNRTILNWVPLITCLYVLLGCAAKKPVQPIRGSVVARYRLSDCKPLPGYEPGLDCKHVQLVPVTLPVK